MKRVVMTGLLLASIGVSQPAFARVTRLCSVSYLTEDGWTDAGTRSVEFATGRELNEATHSFSFSLSANYAIIRLNSGDVAIIELSGAVYMPSFQFSNDDFDRLFRFRRSVTAGDANASGQLWSLAPAPVGAVELPSSTSCATCPRDANGRIQRSEAAKHAFEAKSGHPNGWPGHVVDHIVPLACGGADDPSNMQWQTIEDAKAKDKVERRDCK